jgi:uncharacterized protein
MRVNIDEIKESGLQRRWDLARERVDEMLSGDAAGYRAQGPARLDVSLKKTGRRVLLHARGSAPVAAPCGRCLSAVPAALPIDFQLTFVPEDEYRARPDRDGDDRGDGEGGATFEPQSADEETYAGKELDLAPVVREQLILGLPPYPVCQEGCKGLCSVCGTNLNDRECGCERKVPDPRWAGLEKFRKQDTPKGE